MWFSNHFAHYPVDRLAEGKCNVSSQLRPQNTSPYVSLRSLDQQMKHFAIHSTSMTELRIDMRFHSITLRYGSLCNHMHVYPESGKHISLRKHRATWCQKAGDHTTQYMFIMNVHISFHVPSCFNMIGMAKWNVILQDDIKVNT
jgi:hypothetical protein